MIIRKMKAITVKNIAGKSLLCVMLIAGATVSCNRTEEHMGVTGTENKEYISASEYNAMLAAKNATEDTLFQTINEIDNNLRTIRENQGLMAGMHPERLSKKDEILQTIGALNSLLEENRTKIKKLNGQLTSLRLQRTKWNQESEEMKRFISNKEGEMAKLQQDMSDQASTINYLNQLVNDLRISNNTANDNCRRMDKELHKAWYTLGSYKELKKHNLVEKTGGILGLGRTEEVKPDLEKTYFREIDTREITSIPVKAKDAKLVTHHPVGSYEWEKDGNKGTEYLTIKDPEKFWAASKYLVVEVR